MKGLYQICSRQPVTWKQLGNEKRRRKNGKKFIISDTLYHLIAIYHLISLSMHPLSFLPSAVMCQPSTPHHMMGPWTFEIVIVDWRSIYLIPRTFNVWNHLSIIYISHSLFGTTCKPILPLSHFFHTNLYHVAYTCAHVSQERNICEHPHANAFTSNYIPTYYHAVMQIKLEIQDPIHITRSFWCTLISSLFVQEYLIHFKWFYMQSLT